MRTGRRLESSLLCWIGIGGISMNSWIHVQMCVLSVFVIYCCATNHHKLKHLKPQIFTVSSFCMLEVWEVQLGLALGSHLTAVKMLAGSVLIQRLHQKKSTSQLTRVLAEYVYCCCGTESFGFLLAVASGLPQLLEAAFIFPSCGLSMDQFTIWRLASSRPDRSKRASLQANGVSLSPLLHSLIQKQFIVPVHTQGKGMHTKAQTPRDRAWEWDTQSLSIVYRFKYTYIYFLGLSIQKLQKQHQNINQ